MTGQRPIFVLVPGAYQLPSAWDLLRGELDALGYASRAVKLLTAGTDPRGDLWDDAKAIRAAIEAIGGPVVVLAHSYSGFPVTEGTVGLANVQHLIYLAGFVPDVGESMYTIREVPVPDSTEGLFQRSADPRAEFYADVPDELADLAISQLVDQLHQPFADRVTQAAWHTIPSTYIITEKDASLPVEVQEKMAARTKSVRRIPTGHSPFLSRPAELAALLDDIVKN
jgi:pimeloyl-ACP methyl ester carboxylesterase